MYVSVEDKKSDTLDPNKKKGGVLMNSKNRINSVWSGNFDNHQKSFSAINSLAVLSVRLGVFLLDV